MSLTFIFTFDLDRALPHRQTPAAAGGGEGVGVEVALPSIDRCDGGNDSSVHLLPPANTHRPQTHSITRQSEGLIKLDKS